MDAPTTSMSGKSPLMDSAISSEKDDAAAAVEIENPKAKLKRVLSVAKGKLRMGFFMNQIFVKVSDGKSDMTKQLSQRSDAGSDSDVSEGGGHDQDYEACSAEDLDIYRTFSPIIVHREVLAQKLKPRLRPSLHEHFAAILFADISGFTRLANLLSVEQLQLHISNYFTKLFRCVEDFGGDILKICGDAIMIMWPLGDVTEKCSLEDRAACAQIACLCGRQLLISCGLYEERYENVDIRLSLHCGVGVADVPCYFVGKGGRWEFLISGDALRQIASTEPEAESGQIVISPETYDLVKDHLEVKSTPNGNYLLTENVLIAAAGGSGNEADTKVGNGAENGADYGTEAVGSVVNSVADRADAAAIAADNGSESESSRTVTVTTRTTTAVAEAEAVKASLNPRLWENLLEHPTLDFSNKLLIATRYLSSYMRTNIESLDLLMEHNRTGKELKFFVHESARARISNRGGELKMGELREVVTLFVNIIGLEESFKSKDVETIQSVMNCIIDSHKCFGGALRQFVVDDKGCVAIGALGVPHHTFEDNSVRAVEIANLLRQKIQELGKDCTIGVSRGQAFCGLVGSFARREYAMMGSSVNLAARLMCNCKPGEIIVDERVFCSASHLLQFSDHNKIKAKGYAEPVQVYLYLQALLSPQSLNFKIEETKLEKKFMVGRKTQMDIMKLGIADFLHGTTGCQKQFYFIEGEEGVGKSLIAKQVAARASRADLKIFLAIGAESYSRSEYWLISQILEQIMEFHENKGIPVSDINEVGSDVSEEDLKLTTAAIKLQDGAMRSQPGTPPRQLQQEQQEQQWSNHITTHLPDTGAGGGNGSGKRLSVASVSSTQSLTTCSRYTRFRNWVNENLRYNTRPDGSKQEAQVHGHPLIDVLPLIGSVFKESVPNKNSTISGLKPRKKALLVKTLLVRTLERAFAGGKVMLLVENLQWSDTLSAQALSDYIAVAETSFGIFCYRSTPASRDSEHECFTSLRSAMIPVPLMPLKVQDVGSLAAYVLGPVHKHHMTKENSSRVMKHTQGIPGLIEALMVAYKEHLDKGEKNVSIEGLRTKGQESIVQQFDLLEPRMQAVLKNAAAMGLTFSFAALSEVQDKVVTYEKFETMARMESSIIRLPSGGGSFVVDPSSALRRNSSTVGSRDVENDVAMAIASMQNHRDKNDEKKQLLAIVSKLVECRFLSPAEYKPIKWEKDKADKDTATVDSVVDDYSAADAAVAEDAALSDDTPKRMRTIRMALGASMPRLMECKDTPEIALYALPWTDARGQRRRGWALVSDKKRGHHVEASTTKSSGMVLSGGTSAGDPMDGNGNGGGGVKAEFTTYFRFSHPSIQSTAHALTLALDRVPVHNASIDFLATYFKDTPGVEETCLHHSLELKQNPDQLLYWLMQCTTVSRISLRHSLFIQRAMQLICVAVKEDPFSSMEAFSLNVVTLIRKHCEAVGPRDKSLPSRFAYESSDLYVPDWSAHRQAGPWLFVFGQILRDLMWSMVALGEFRLVKELNDLSASLLAPIIASPKARSPSMLQLLSMLTTQSSTRSTSPSDPQPADSSTDTDPSNIFVPRTISNKDSSRVVGDPAVSPPRGDSSSGGVVLKPRLRMWSIIKAAGEALSFRSPKSKLQENTSTIDGHQGAAAAAAVSGIGGDGGDRRSSLFPDFLKSSRVVSNLAPGPMAAGLKVSSAGLEEEDEPTKSLPGDGGGVYDRISVSEIAATTEGSVGPYATATAAATVPMRLTATDEDSGYDSDDSPVEKLIVKGKASPMLISYIHSFIRGQEAMAFWMIMRGDLANALELVMNAIYAARWSCSSPELEALCMPRLLALQSLCCVGSSDMPRADKLLGDAETFLVKLTDVAMSEAITAYFRARPFMSNTVLQLHKWDSGAWVIMVVRALRKCGDGAWGDGLADFTSAQNELIQVNDKSILFLVRVLHAWSLFLSGDLDGFQARARAIKQYADVAEEPLVLSWAMELISIRFSLSCFYEASDILLAKMRETVPRAEGFIAPTPTSSTIPTPSGSSLNIVADMTFCPKKEGLNLYQSIADTYLNYRRYGSLLTPSVISDLCSRLSNRTPASYITGFYMFLIGLCATAVYEHLVAVKAEHTRDFMVIQKELKSIVEALDNLAFRHVVLRSFAVALEARRYRVRGQLSKAVAAASMLSPKKMPDCSCPLGLAYLLMESSVSKLKLLQAAPLSSSPVKPGTSPVKSANGQDTGAGVDNASRTDTLTSIISDAKASLKLFAKFDADIEVAELEDRIAEASELLSPQDATSSSSKRSPISDKLNTSGMREAHLRGGAARAYWLELSKVDHDEDLDD